MSYRDGALYARDDLAVPAADTTHRRHNRPTGEPGALHDEPGPLQWLQKDVVLVVRDLTHHDLIDDRHIYARRYRLSGPADAAGQQLAQRRRTLQELPAMQLCHVLLPLRLL